MYVLAATGFEMLHSVLLAAAGFELQHSVLLAATGFEMQPHSVLSRGILVKLHVAQITQRLSGIRFPD